MPFSQKSSAPVISARNLRKSYGDFTAVDDISFEVAPGEAFGLLGPNGAGKSTTMRMIGGVSQRSAGELSIMGLDPDQHGPRYGLIWGWCRSRTIWMRN